MTVGLSTYAFFWQWQTVADAPLSLTDMIDQTAAWDVERFQICDYPPSSPTTTPNSRNCAGTPNRAASGSSWARGGSGRTICGAICDSPSGST
jgi:hypothetical protein